MKSKIIRAVLHLLKEKALFDYEAYHIILDMEGVVPNA